jgi:hypothetical protein
MTEGGKIKKLKLNPPTSVSRGGTPQGSRAASPLPRPPGSRANSPDGPRGPFWSKSIFTRNKLTICRPACVDSSFWNPDLPHGRGNSCSHPSIWHTQQRPLEGLPSSYWRIQGESPEIHCHCQGCQCLRKRGPDAATWSLEGQLRFAQGSSKLKSDVGYFLCFLLLFPICSRHLDTCFFALECFNMNISRMWSMLVVHSS